MAEGFAHIHKANRKLVHHICDDIPCGSKGTLQIYVFDYMNDIIKFNGGNILQIIFV